MLKNKYNYTGPEVVSRQLNNTQRTQNLKGSADHSIWTRKQLKDHCKTVMRRERNDRKQNRNNTRDHNDRDSYRKRRFRLRQKLINKTT